MKNLFHNFFLVMCSNCMKDWATDEQKETTTTKLAHTLWRQRLNRYDLRVRVCVHPFATFPSLSQVNEIRSELKTLLDAHSWLLSSENHLFRFTSVVIVVVGHVLLSRYFEAIWCSHDYGVPAKGFSSFDVFAFGIFGAKKNGFRAYHHRQPD